MCKVYSGYDGTSEIEHGLCACTIDHSVQAQKPSSITFTTVCQPVRGDNPRTIASRLHVSPIHVDKP